MPRSNTYPLDVQFLNFFSRRNLNWDGFWLLMNITSLLPPPILHPNYESSAVLGFNLGIYQISLPFCFRRNLEYFASSLQNSISAIDPENGGGELTIKLPKECLKFVSERKTFRLSVEFSLEHPKGGVQFVLPRCEGKIDMVRVLNDGSCFER